VPARVAHSSVAPTAVAPDGIAIHTFDLPAAACVGVAEGRIPPGRFGIHRHLSLEQYTYVVSGRVTAVTADAEHTEGAALLLSPGDLMLTLPGESLQFVNDGPETARVLFICAPPYPPGDVDTRMLDSHGLYRAGDVPDAIRRLETVRAAFNEIVDGRIATLQQR
jgi:mannose-6-phosphate isomerase-like protein (cupin superfamily)